MNHDKVSYDYIKVLLHFLFNNYILTAGCSNVYCSASKSHAGFIFGAVKGWNNPQRNNQKFSLRIMENTTNTLFTIKDLLEAGVHFGHRKNMWNPKMAPYIYGINHGIHIIDLTKTYFMLHKALEVLRSCAAKNKKVLFVGTKKQAADAVALYAIQCGQHYINHRWRGGVLTNWSTVSKSIKTMEEYEKTIEGDTFANKKEKTLLMKDHEKLSKSLGGVRNMGGLPDLVFVIDTRENFIAIQEANKLGIPVIAIVDTNSKLEGVTYPIPGNDDATKSIELYMRLASYAALQGVQDSLSTAGVDIGSSADFSFSQSVADNDVIAEESITISEVALDSATDSNIENK